MLRTLSLKFRTHTNEEAVDATKIAIKNALASKQAVVKVVHGYGSDGIGGSNKSAIQDYLTLAVNDLSIKTFIPGEKLRRADLNDLSRRFSGYKNDFLQLQRDCGNQGITLIILR
ncbi:MAG: Smr/MutS family protein [Balneolales bacterium]|nr:Smr/MutS family protein [Balneolales bacterium]